MLIPWKNKSGQWPEGRPAPLAEFRTEMNRLFDSFLREPMGALGETFAAMGRWTPTLDVTENDTTVTVRAELPGVDPNDLDISVTGERLTIAGEKKESIEKKDQDIYHRESRYGSFSRSVTLPTSIDSQDVKAEYAHGVLTVTLKKTPGATVKKIPVTVTEKNVAGGSL
jgi:HSP20 family protein